MRVAAVLAPLAAPVAADTYDGTYYWAGTDPVQGCATDGYAEMSIEIDGPRIFFIETTCELSNPTALRDMPEATLFDATCSGEGDKWTERMMFYQTYDGIAVLSRGAARTYSRCE